MPLTVGVLREKWETALLFPRLLFVLALTVLAGACHKKAPPADDLRGVTHELVAAAQNVTGRKSEITIRREIEPPRAGPRARLSADHIYITLAESSQRAALEQALDQVARRDGLELARRSAAAGIVRLDFEKEGRRTHSVHIITPVAESRPSHASETRGPKLAVILDDLGYDRSSADALFALSFPLTVSVLPLHPLSTEVAEEAHRRGYQVLLHLPMESAQDGARPEAIELREGMSPGEIDKTLAVMLESVPHAAGVNNHQGSRATADPQLMFALMRVLRRRGLFFIDSRTTVDTVGYEIAQRDGIRAAYRNVFLDDTPTRKAVLKQIALAERNAERQGWAIAIGHPHPGTLAALEEALPRLQARGIRLVFASDLAH